MDEHTKEICVVGSEEFLLGFRLAGVKRTYKVNGNDVQSYVSVLEDLMDDDVAGIIIVNEKDFQKIPERKRTMFESSSMPIFVVVSEKMGASDYLRNKIIQAVGIDLFK